MPTWKLSPQHKKSAVEKMFFYNEGKIITIEQGFRWATFSVESDERPLTDAELVNEDGYELGCIDNDESWEMWDMVDGCWLEIDKGNDKVTDEDLEEFERAWEADSYEAVEYLGWSQDDTEYFYYGPLELTNEDTGEVFTGQGNDNSMPDVPVTLTFEDKIELLRELAEEKKAITGWYPADINPVRNGTYQAIDVNEEIAWPFPSNIFSAEWDGKSWNKTVTKWRGLTKDPSL